MVCFRFVCGFYVVGCAVWVALWVCDLGLVVCYLLVVGFLVGI